MYIRVIDKRNNSLVKRTETISSSLIHVNLSTPILVTVIIKNQYNICITRREIKCVRRRSPRRRMWVHRLSHWSLFATRRQMYKSTNSMLEY